MVRTVDEDRVAFAILTMATMEPVRDHDIVAGSTRPHSLQRRKLEGRRSAAKPEVGSALSKRLADLAGERVRCDRLLEEHDARVEEAVLNDRLVGVARHEEHLDVGAQGADAKADASPSLPPAAEGGRGSETSLRESTWSSLTS